MLPRKRFQQRDDNLALRFQPIDLLFAAGDYVLGFNWSFTLARHFGSEKGDHFGIKLPFVKLELFQDEKESRGINK